jgi:pseudouridine-5'-phosphate glycosidase
VKKVSRRDLPIVLADKSLGATTVSSTIIAADLAGIDVFVTGGIGGVHRGYEQTMDASADLRELGQTPVTVVSAGVKSILDIPRTLEYLETEGVPVITYGSEWFPAFFSASSGIKSPTTMYSTLDIAKVLF